MILAISLIHDGSLGNMNAIDVFLKMAKKVTTKQRLKIDVQSPRIVFDKDLEEYYFIEPKRFIKINIVGDGEIDLSGHDVTIQD